LSSSQPALWLPPRDISPHGEIVRGPGSGPVLEQAQPDARPRQINRAVGVQLPQQGALLTRLRSEVVAETAENSELLTELEKAICTIETLTKERDDLAERNELLNDELKTQKANWATYEQFRDQVGAEQDIGPDSAIGIRKFANAHEAYQRAKADFGGPLLSLESAEESAQNSPFKSTRRLCETFEALCPVAMEWKEGKGRLGRSLKDALKAEALIFTMSRRQAKGSERMSTDSYIRASGCSSKSIPPSGQDNRTSAFRFTGIATCRTSYWSWAIVAGTSSTPKPDGRHTRFEGGVVLTRGGQEGRETGEANCFSWRSR